jgi:hypothetical protein
MESDPTTGDINYHGTAHSLVPDRGKLSWNETGVFQAWVITWESLEGRRRFLISRPE